MMTGVPSLRGEGAGLAAIDPSTRGAPGALGFSAGSNASERRPLGAGGWAGCATAGRGGGGARSSAGAEFLEPIIVIVLHALERRLELLIAVLHLLDLSGELPKLV